MTLYAKKDWVAGAKVVVRAYREVRFSTVASIGAKYVQITGHTRVLWSTGQNPKAHEYQVWPSQDAYLAHMRAEDLWHKLKAFFSSWSPKPIPLTTLEEVSKLLGVNTDTTD